MPSSKRAKQLMPVVAVPGLEKVQKEKRHLHEEKVKAEDEYEDLVE